MLAKICSDKNKPNGQYRILPNRDAVMEFVQELPIRKVQIFTKLFFSKPYRKVVHFVINYIPPEHC